MEVTAKSYGKILVFGAYSLLEPGNIGLVVNVNKGTTATAQETDTGKIVIDLSNFEIKVYGKVINNKLVIEKDEESLKFIKNAVEYCFQYLTFKRQRIKDMRLITFNDPELFLDKNLKAGFGSSATATVSTVAAVMKLHDIDDPGLVYKISRYSHFKSQGGLGSGFDISSACYGSHFFISENSPPEEDFQKYLKSEGGTLREEFEWPMYFLPLLIFTGSSSSTQELVKKVMDYKKKSPKEYSMFMYRYNQLNMKLKYAFDNNRQEEIIKLLEDSWRSRKELGRLSGAGIEPEKYTRLIDELKKNGAITAGLAGAGGGDSIIALCDNAKSRKKLMAYLDKKKLTVLDDIKLFSRGYEYL